MGLIKTYSLPLFVALGMHLGLASALYRGWTPDQELSAVLTPKAVNAKLIVLAQEAKKQNKNKKETVKPPQAVTSPKAKEKPPAEAGKAVEDKAAEKRAKQGLRERQRLERLAALGDLAQSNLEQSLNEEMQSLSDIESEEAMQTYRASIYEQVRKNWSRPPSARNGMQARLLVELIPTGEVISVALVEGSGNSSFDRSAEQAIRQARRFDVPAENAVFEKYFRRFYFLFQPEDLLR
jgi:colicin import membrane protein